MDKLFKLKEHGTDVRTEVLAGLTTFFAMSYILFVNPAMLSQTGMPAQGVFLATIIGSVAGTLMMAFYANLPYAQAPGMGLNGHGLHLWSDLALHYPDQDSEGYYRVYSISFAFSYFSWYRCLPSLCRD